MVSSMQSTIFTLCGWLICLTTKASRITRCASASCLASSGLTTFSATKRSVCACVARKTMAERLSLSTPMVL